MRPGLAVLITYYNEREILRECLESLFADAPVPDEVLVYDDASSFPARDYVPQGLPVRVIAGDVNRGPSHGRNVLLRHAHSEYIHFHDADDLFQPQWCARVRHAFQDSRVDAVFTEVAYCKDGRMVGQSTLGRECSSIGDLVRYCIRGAILTSAGIYRRSAVVGIGGYREGLWQSEDYDFHVRLAASGARYTVIPEPLVKVRVRTASRSQNRWEVWTSAVCALKKLGGELDPVYRPELAEKAAEAGSILFDLGAYADARQAFELSDELGPPTYARRRRAYRMIARMFGPLAAEKAGALYRKRVPGAIRESVAVRG